MMKQKNFHLFFETSAYDGTNVEIAFAEAAKLVFLNYINTQLKARQSNGGNVNHGSAANDARQQPQTTTADRNRQLSMMSNISSTSEDQDNNNNQSS
jgi:hypothetical protein